MASVPKPSPSVAMDYFQRKMDCSCGAVELKHWLEEKAAVRVIDVRRLEDYRNGHIPGALSLPKEKWENVQGLSKDQTNVIYCYTQTCHLAAAAALSLAKQGYSVVELEGGYDNWKNAGLPVQQETLQKV